MCSTSQVCVCVISDNTNLFLGRAGAFFKFKIRLWSCTPTEISYFLTLLITLITNAVSVNQKVDYL